MTIGQGLHKQTTIGKQVALGTPLVGAGGQILRRKTAIFTATRDMYANDEIVSHMQDTGVTYGQKKSGGKIDAVLSPGTYKLAFAGICRKDFVAGAVGGPESDVTAQAANPQFTSAATATWLTDGLKVGDVVRPTGWTGGNIGGNARNFLITALTELTMTGIYLDGTPVVADASGEAVTFTVVGKKTMAPLTGHTNDFFTFEEWYSDLSKSEVFPDCKFNQLQPSLPATGNSAFSMDIVGVGTRTRGTAQSFTAPASETTTDPVCALHGAIYVNSVLTTNVTSLQLTLDSGIAPMGASIGSNVSPDVNQGRLKVSGTFSALFKNTLIQDLYDAETNISIIAVALNDTTATADFIAFTMGKVKLTGDAPDDGEKGIMRTYPFTAELNGAGGTALAWDKTIISIQDSAA